uniref:UDP glucuronosyltransferase 5 family, polypeptide D1 n=1 Tax=Acanthochromis polyacanthus TaxID=80966 RepID=A0A3Q1G8A0_9TELE
MRLIYCCSALLVLILLPTTCQSGNILVIPTEGSHWINMDILLQALHSRGHNLTIIRSSQNWYIKDSTYYSTYTVPIEIGFDKEFISRIISEIIDFQRGALPLTSSFHLAVGMLGTLTEAHRGLGEYLSGMLDDKKFMRMLNDTKFDLVLTDPCWGGGIILAKYLNLPLVYNVRWLIPEEAHLAIAPSPISYIPVMGSGLTDKMSFLQRVKNVIFYVVSQTQKHLVAKKVYQKICDKYLGPNNDFYQLMIDAEIWLMRADFVFEFPRPTMPNVVYMGGFHMEHGVIIMSLGTFVSELPADMANEIAAAFAELPQKVIWRYKGSRPDTLGNNTLLVDWMPQNDLLGHPKVKLFVRSANNTDG